MVNTNEAGITIQYKVLTLNAKPRGSKNNTSMPNTLFLRTGLLLGTTRKNTGERI